MLIYLVHVTMYMSNQWLCLYAPSSPSFSLGVEIQHHPIVYGRPGQLCPHSVLGMELGHSQRPTWETDTRAVERGTEEHHR